MVETGAEALPNTLETVAGFHLRVHSSPSLREFGLRPEAQDLIAIIPDWGPQMA